MIMKLGLVHGMDERQESFGVQVDGSTVQKQIHPRNLMHLELPDHLLALVACMEESDQWAFMKQFWENLKESLLSD